MPISTPTPSLGVGQTWQAVTRTSGTTYTNTTGKPIVTAAFTTTAAESVAATLEIDSVTAAAPVFSVSGALGKAAALGIVPHGSTYRWTFTGAATVVELR